MLLRENEEAEAWKLTAKAKRAQPHRMTKQRVA